LALYPGARIDCIGNVAASAVRNNVELGYFYRSSEGLFTRLYLFWRRRTSNRTRCNLGKSIGIKASEYSSAFVGG
jgi:hypothetical protein